MTTYTKLIKGFTLATGRPDRGIYLNSNRETQPTAVSDVTGRYIVNNVLQISRLLLLYDVFILRLWIPRLLLSYQHSMLITGHILFFRIVFHIIFYSHM